MRNGPVMAFGVDDHVKHGEAFTNLQRTGLSQQVAGVGAVQEIDVEVRRPAYP